MDAAALILYTFLFLMDWKDCAYIFYTYTNCINDLEFLQLLCNDFGLHLYAEENKKGTNYMISGKTFVIDIFYERKEKVVQDYIEDTQSLGSSVVQIGKERVENIYSAIQNVSLSLMEEEWSSYFRIFTLSIIFHLKNKDYHSTYNLIKNLLKYDKEEEAEGFPALVNQLKELSEKIVYPIEYSVLLHKPIALHSVKSSGKLFDLFGLFSCIEQDYTHSLYNLQKIEEIPTNPVHVNIIIEMLTYNIDIKIEDKIIISGSINGRKCKIEIRDDGYILVDGEIDRYRTLLLKRTESMYHVIRETEIQIM